MYFKEKENTNIDEELQGKKGFDIKKYKPLLLIICVVLIIFVIIIMVVNSMKKPTPEPVAVTTYSIELTGAKSMIITLGNDYIEPGYLAYDSNGNDLTNQVKVSSNINPNEVGNYEITYTVADKTEVRYIEIKEQSEETYIYLKGKKNIYLSLSEKYNEPGYVAHDTIEGDVTKKVKVSGKVNNKQKGLYKIVYSYTNANNITTQVERNVIVGENKPQ